MICNSTSTRPTQGTKSKMHIFVINIRQIKKHLLPYIAPPFFVVTILHTPVLYPAFQWKYYDADRLLAIS